MFHFMCASIRSKFALADPSMARMQPAPGASTENAVHPCQGDQPGPTSHFPFLLQAPQKSTLTNIPQICAGINEQFLCTSVWVQDSFLFRVYFSPSRPKLIPTIWLSSLEGWGKPGAWELSP